MTRILRVLALTAAFAATATMLRADEGDVTLECAWNARNIELSDSGATSVRRSGTPLFIASFDNPEAWASVENYRSLLVFSFGQTDDPDASAPVLRITRGPGMPGETDTAWNLRSKRIEIDPELSGREFRLRCVARASEPAAGNVDDGAGWRTSAIWYDADGEQVGRNDFSLTAGGVWTENVFSGSVPDHATWAEVRLGYDVPNVREGHFVALESAVFEIMTDEDARAESGSFLTGVLPGSKTLRCEARIPEGCAAKFQTAFSDAAEGDPGAPASIPSEFAGPGGDPGAYYELTPGRELELDRTGDFMRIRAVLVPNGKESPSLISLTAGDRVMPGWRFGGDSTAPVVELTGVRSAPSEDAHAPLVFEISDESIIPAGSISVALDGEDATGEFELARLAGGLRLSQKSEGVDFAPGLHVATVGASDIYGNSCESRRAFYVGKAPETPKITVREDGTTLIDGEPFFPVGIYGVTKREFNGDDIDEAFRGLKEAGFNFAHSYSMPRTDEFLSAAEKYGFKLWSVARMPDERFVETERFSPAILAWYLGDDTSYNTTVEELRDYDRSVKAVDPTRITVQADPIHMNGSVSNYRPYANETDAFLPEIYPVRKAGEGSGDACVAQTVRDMRTSRSDARSTATGNRAIWPIIQYFQGWGWERFPTYQELRAMSFAAIASGANGITWYTYGGFVNPEKKTFNYGVTTTPERWRNISQIATQIRDLSPLLVQEPDEFSAPTAVVTSGPKRNPLGDETVVALLKKRGAERLLIFVNTAPSKVTTEIRTPPEKRVEDSPEVLYDESDRATAVFTENGLKETLEPFGVRICRWTAAE